MWALNAFAMHWDLRPDGIRFRYQMSGVAFAPFFANERVPLLLARGRRRHRRLLPRR
jgi:hypothetical protein